MTKIQIIEETASYYKNNPRSVAVDSDACVYFNPETKTTCAFARCCTEEGVQFLHRNYEGKSVQSNFLEFLKEEYAGHHISFWNQIQMLHDNGHNWCERGLSAVGIENVELLKQEFS